MTIRMQRLERMVATEQQVLACDGACGTLVALHEGPKPATMPESWAEVRSGELLLHVCSPCQRYPLSDVLRGTLAAKPVDKPQRP